EAADRRHLALVRPLPDSEPRPAAGDAADPARGTEPFPHGHPGGASLRAVDRHGGRMGPARRGGSAAGDAPGGDGAVNEPDAPTLAEKAAAKARASLGMVCAALPYLSGLAN